MKGQVKLLLLLLVAPCLLLTLASDDCFAVSDCLYEGVSFSDGAVSCQTGHQFRCNDGSWSSLDLSCAAPAPSPTVINPADCNCTPAELANCDSSGQACCVSIEFGRCVKKCCQRQ